MQSQDLCLRVTCRKLDMIEMEKIMKIRENLKLYGKYASVCTQSVMEYKLSFALMLIARFLIAFGELIAIRFLFSGFTQLKGYTYDRVMLRPRSLIFQIVASRFEVGRTGPLFTAVITLALGIRHSQITWNLITVWTFAAMIAGGTLLFIGLFMLEASFCFFSIEDTSLINVLTYGAKSHGKYPIDIYGKGILRFCTYVIPYTLIQYYPLQFLLGKTRNWYLAFYPLGIVVFLSVCGLVWRFGVRRYKSCGS